MMKYREWGLSKIEEKKVQLQVGYSTERDGVSTNFKGNIDILKIGLQYHKTFFWKSFIGQCRMTFHFILQTIIILSHFFFLREELINKFKL